MRTKPLGRATASPVATTFASTTARRDADRAVYGGLCATEAALTALKPHGRHEDLAEASRLVAEADQNLRLAKGLLAPRKEARR